MENDPRVWASTLRWGLGLKRRCSLVQRMNQRMNSTQTTAGRQGDLMEADQIAGSW